MIRKKKQRTELQELANALERIDSRAFCLWVDRYLRCSCALDDWRMNRTVCADIDTDFYFQTCDMVDTQADRIRSDTRDYLRRVMNFQYRFNGDSAADLQFRLKVIRGVKIVKRQQAELSAAILDSVDMIKDMIQQSKKIRKVVQQPHRTIRKAARLMDVLSERMEHRPTTLLKLNGKDKKIKQLNQTFKNVNDYEEQYRHSFVSENQHDLAGQVITRHTAIGQAFYPQIEEKNEMIRNDCRQLDLGLTILEKLVKKGYYPRIEKNLDLINSEHRRRILAFRSQVIQCRMSA